MDRPLNKKIDDFLLLLDVVGLVMEVPEFEGEYEKILSQSNLSHKSETANTRECYQHLYEKFSSAEGRLIIEYLFSQVKPKLKAPDPNFVADRYVQICLAVLHYKAEGPPDHKSIIKQREQIRKKAKALFNELPFECEEMYYDIGQDSGCATSAGTNVQYGRAKTGICELRKTLTVLAASIEQSEKNSQNRKPQLVTRKGDIARANCQYLVIRLHNYLSWLQPSETQRIQHSEILADTANLLFEPENIYTQSDAYRAIERHYIRMGKNGEN